MSQEIEKIKQDMGTFYSDLMKRNQELFELNSELDMRKNDLEHLLNPRICKLNASQIAKVSSDYRQILAERADVKSEISSIQSLLHMSVADYHSAAQNNKQKRKRYTVRIESETFKQYHGQFIGKISYPKHT